MVNFIHTSNDSNRADTGKRTARLAASSGSVVIHGAVLLSLIFASYLQVKPLAEPRVASEPLIWTVLPPPAAAAAPPPPRGHVEPRVAETKPPDTAPEEIPDTVQPQEVPEDPVTAVKDDSGEMGFEEGVEGGTDDGVLGGTRGGVKGGIPDGDPNGIPGGDEDGVPHGFASPEQPIRLTEDVRPPERVTFLKPDYPELARIARAEGKVILEIVVGRTGDVEEVRVLKSDPLFDQAAVEAVRMWKFQPALQNGRAVTVYLTVIVAFELK